MILAGLASARVLLAQSPVAGAGGRATFETYCATCHGTSAKGDGPLASSLTKRPADLTLLAKRNGGVFSPDQGARIIDGRDPGRGHGGGNMPVWGDAFAKTVEAVSVDERIRRLVTFLESIQGRA